MEMRALSDEETAGIAAASQKLSGSSHGIADCFGFDITFTGPDGLEVEPSRPVLVGVSSEWIEDYGDMVLAYQDEEQTVGYLELLETDMPGLYFYADTFTSFLLHTGKELKKRLKIILIWKQKVKSPPMKIQSRLNPVMICPFQRKETP